MTIVLLIKKDYSSIIGSLRYATNYTKPNIAYAIGIFSRFTSKPIKLESSWCLLSKTINFLVLIFIFGISYALESGVELKF